MSAMNKRIKKIQSGVTILLEEYSPLAMTVLIALFFFPIDRHVQQPLLFFICGLPGALYLLAKPSLLKNPTILLSLLFLLYFSLQDIRGQLPMTFRIVKWECIRSFIIMGPMLILSAVTPERKLYPHAIRMILLAAVAGAIYSLVTFYSDNLFPAQRFIMSGGTQHPGHSAMKCGFATIIALVFFIQSGRRLKATDVFTLACFLILLSATLVSHVRTTTLALLVVAATSLFIIKKQTKKVLCLYAIIATAIAAYLFATLTAPEPEAPVAHPTPGPQGAFSTKDAKSLNGRVYIWQDLLSRMKPFDWIIGKGLGENYFLQIPPEESQKWGRYPHFFPTTKGFIIHTHSGYLWALYFGGTIGLLIVLALLFTAGIASIRSKKEGYLPLALLMFCGIILLTDTSKLLLGAGGTAYLIFWIPIGLAASFSEKPLRAGSATE